MSEYLNRLGRLLGIGKSWKPSLEQCWGVKDHTDYIIHIQAYDIDSSLEWMIVVGRRRFINVHRTVGGEEDDHNNHGGTNWRTSWKAETWEKLWQKIDIFGVWEWMEGSWLCRSYIYKCEFDVCYPFTRKVFYQSIPLLIFLTMKIRWEHETLPHSNAAYHNDTRTGGKKITYAYEGSRTPRSTALHWIPQGFRKKQCRILF